MFKNTSREPSQHDKKSPVTDYYHCNADLLKLDLGESTPISLVLELFASRKSTRLESTSQWQWLSKILFNTPGLRQSSKHFQWGWSSWPLEPNIASCYAWNNEKTNTQCYKTWLNPNSSMPLSIKIVCCELELNYTRKMWRSIPRSNEDCLGSLRQRIAMAAYT